MSAIGLPQLESEFTAWWPHYPRKLDKDDAKKAYFAKRRSGISSEILLQAVQRYAIEREGKDVTFTKYPASWLRKGSFENDVLISQPLFTTSARAQRQAFHGFDGWDDIERNKPKRSAQEILAERIK